MMFFFEMPISPKHKAKGAFVLHDGRVSSSFDEGTPVAKWEIKLSDELSVRLNPITDEVEVEKELDKLNEDGFLFASMRNKVMAVNHSKLFIQEDMLNDISNMINEYLKISLVFLADKIKAGKDTGTGINVMLHKDEKVWAKCEDYVTILDMVMQGYTLNEQEVVMSQLDSDVCN